MDIVCKPDQRLRQISQDVSIDELPHVIKQMDEMYDLMVSRDDAVGISAPQVGINKRFLISAIIREKKIQYFYVINPVLISVSKEMDIDEEGCLSVPSINGYVMRHTWIEIEFRDIKWNLHKLKLKGLDARIILHEIDHLNGILFTDRLIKYQKHKIDKPKHKKKVIFFGTPEYSVSSLEYLCKKYDVIAVVSQISKPVGRDQKIIDSPVVTYAKSKKIKVFTPIDLKDNDFIQSILTLKSDIFVVVAYGKIIPQILLDIPKYGAINLHGSVLPKYRGASPIQQALLQGDTKSGVTMQQMDIKMDEGSIIHIETIDIEKNDNFITLLPKFEKANISCLEYLDDYMSGKIMLVLQDESKVRYCKKISKQDGRIEPSKDTAIEIYNKYRAYIMWPKIYLLYKDKRVILHEVSLDDDKKQNKKYNMFYIEDKKLKLSTKKGDLIINKLQVEGKKIIDGMEFNI